ncbi:MAG: tail fiber domain-containing protein [Taibaiella sp.]|jgi:hypothetical protein
MQKHYMNVKLALLALCLLVSFRSLGQSPGLFNYQAALRNPAGEILASQSVGLKLSILESSPTGTSMYSEVHNAITTAQGLVNVQIGTGTNVIGDFAAINWASGEYYLKVEMQDGVSFVNLGSSRLVSVPYALYSNKSLYADTAVKATYADTAAYLSGFNGFTGWFLDGNSGIDSTNFIGTVDSMDLVFRTNNKKNMVLRMDGSLYIGDTALIPADPYNGLPDNVGFDLDQQTGFYFNKYKAAVRAGVLADSSVCCGLIPYAGSFPTSTSPAYLREDSMGYGSVAMGIANKAKGPGSIALGAHNKTSVWGFDVAIGIGCEVKSGYGAIAMGRQAIAAGELGPSISIGYRTKSFGGYSTAMGNSTETNGWSSFAIGERTKANGLGSVSMGYYTIANARASLSIGRYNDTLVDAENSTGGTAGPVFIATSPAFIIGNGSSNSTRSNAFMIRYNGDAHLAGILTQSSDRRLKKDIEPLSLSLDKVQALKGVTYHWNGKNNHDSTRLQYGLIAQEVEKIFPDLVTTESNGYKSVNYIGLVPVLIEAVKELKQQMVAKEGELNALKASNETTIKDLEGKVNHILLLMEKNGVAGK